MNDVLLNNYLINADRPDTNGVSTFSTLTNTTTTNDDVGGMPFNVSSDQENTLKRQSLVIQSTSEHLPSQHEIKLEPGGHINKNVTVDGMYICFTCQNEFINREALYKHEKYCGIVEYSFAQQKELVDHDAYKCENCSETFDSMLLLVEHEEICIIKSFVCNLCYQGFENLNELCRHEISHNTSKPKSAELSCWESMDDGIPGKSPFTGGPREIVGFTSIFPPDRQGIYREQVKSEDSTTGELRSLDKCQSNIDGNISMDKDMEGNDDSIVIVLPNDPPDEDEHCFQSMHDEEKPVLTVHEEKYVLKMHEEKPVLKMHEEKPVFKMHEEKPVFKMHEEKPVLKNHVLNQHVNSTPEYLCKYCGRGFKGRTCLNKHEIKCKEILDKKMLKKLSVITVKESENLRARRTEDGMYHCNVCRKSYKYRESFYKHEKFCGKNFQFPPQKERIEGKFQFTPLKEKIEGKFLFTPQNKKIEGRFYNGDIKVKKEEDFESTHHGMAEIQPLNASKFKPRHMKDLPSNFMVNVPILDEPKDENPIVVVLPNDSCNNDEVDSKFTVRNDHGGSSSTESSFLCKYCGITMKEKSNLQLHEMKCKINMLGKNMPKVLQEGEKFFCSKCRLQVTSKTTGYRHAKVCFRNSLDMSMKDLSGNKSWEFANAKGVYHCGGCQKTYNYKESFLKHEKNCEFNRKRKEMYDEKYNGGFSHSFNEMVNSGEKHRNNDNSKTSLENSFEAPDTTIIREQYSQNKQSDSCEEDVDDIDNSVVIVLPNDPMSDEETDHHSTFEEDMTLKEYALDRSGTPTTEVDGKETTMHKYQIKSMIKKTMKKLIQEGNRIFCSICRLEVTSKTTGYRHVKVCSKISHLETSLETSDSDEQVRDTFNNPIKNASRAYLCNTCEKGFEYREALYKHEKYCGINYSFAQQKLSAVGRYFNGDISHSSSDEMVGDEACNESQIAVSRNDSTATDDGESTSNKNGDTKEHFTIAGDSYMNQFTCQYCNKAFKVKLAVHKHEQKCKLNLDGKTVTKLLREGNKFYCSKCGQYFMSKTTGYRHTNVCVGKVLSEKSRGKPEEEVGPSLVPYTNNDGTYSCNVCQRNFKYRQPLLKHQKTCGTRYSFVKVKKESFECNNCGKAFVTALSLRKHEKACERKSFICNICGEGFIDVDILAAHKVLHSSCDEIGQDREKFLCNSYNICSDTTKISHEEKDNKELPKFKLKYDECSKQLLGDDD